MMPFHWLEFLLTCQCCNETRVNGMMLLEALLNQVPSMYKVHQCEIWTVMFRVLSYLGGQVRHRGMILLPKLACANKVSKISEAHS